MSRHNRRTVASFVTAASVLAVLFATFFAVSDVLPIPDSFREIIGFASADTTDVGDLSLESEPATNGADPLPSIDTSAAAELDRSGDTTATAGLGSEETSAIAQPNGAADGEATGDGATDGGEGSTARTPSSAPAIQALGVNPPIFPTSALMVFRYPTASGFTVGYTRADDADPGVDYYRLLLEEIPTLGSTTVLSSTTATTAADEYAASGLLAGAYRVSVTAVDGDANESDPLVGEVLVGHARPQVLVTYLDPNVQAAVASGGWINWGSAIQLVVAVQTEAPFFKIHSTDLLGATAVTASLESSSTTSTVISIAGEGQRVITVSAADCYGLESTPTAIALKVDRTAPTPVNLLRAHQPIGTTELRVSWVRSLDLTSGISHYVVELTDADGEVAARVTRSAFANPYYRFTNLEYGYYDITVTPVDVAGNAGPSRTIAAELSEDVAKGDQDSGTGAGRSSGGSSGPGDTPADSDGADGETPSAGPTTPSTPITEPVDEVDTPSRPIDTKINDSNRLYWLIGAVGFGLGLLMIYFAAVRRAFSKKSGDL